MNSSVKNVYTGEVYQQLDDIYSYLLEFNTKNMAKDECVNEDIKNNQEMKEDVMTSMSYLSPPSPYCILKGERSIWK